MYKKYKIESDGSPKYDYQSYTIKPERRIYENTEEQNRRLEGGKADRLKRRTETESKSNKSKLFSIGKVLTLIGAILNTYALLILIFKNDDIFLNIFSVILLILVWFGRNKSLKYNNKYWIIYSLFIGCIVSNPFDIVGYILILINSFKHNGESLTDYEEKNSYQFYKKVWFWILVIIIICIAALGSSDSTVSENEVTKEVTEIETTIDKEELKNSYDTGITYDNLARNPENYIGEKVKFEGKVIQVIEGKREVQLRLAVNGDYNNIIYCTYDSSIVSSRVLENDYITVMGLSSDLLTYTSTLGAPITIPSMLVQKIDTN